MQVELHSFWISALSWRVGGERHAAAGLPAKNLHTNRTGAAWSPRDGLERGRYLLRPRFKLRSVQPAGYSPYRCAVTPLCPARRAYTYRKWVRPQVYRELSHVFDTQCSVAAAMTQAPAVSRSVRALLITLYHSANLFFFPLFLHINATSNVQCAVQKGRAQCHRRVGKQWSA